MDHKAPQERRADRSRDHARAPREAQPLVGAFRENPSQEFVAPAAMKAVLRNLESLSVPDLESFVPSISECFGIAVTAHFGAEGEPGADLFEFTVCTPAWLED